MELGEKMSKENNEEGNSLRQAVWTRAMFTAMFLLSMETEATPGAIVFEKAHREIHRYQKLIKKYLNISLKKHLITTGHRAGSYQDYPTDMDNLPAKEIADLMDESFFVNGLQSIEIDVQKSIWDGDVYIIHDRLPDKKPNGRKLEYLKRNSLKNVLSYFMDKGYADQGKKIFIEIKTTNTQYISHPELDQKDKQLIDSTWNVINGLIKGHKHGEDLKKSINFVSFNFYALQRLFSLGSRNDSYWIATSNGMFSKFILSFYGLGSLNRFMLEKLKTTTWLTGVWFDPYHISKFSKVFQKINSKRIIPLKLYLSTYGQSLGSFIRVLKKNTKYGALESVEGLIFDLKRKH